MENEISDCSAGGRVRIRAGPPSRLMNRVELAKLQPAYTFSLQPRAPIIRDSGSNPLDLRSAIAHQLKRSNQQQSRLAWEQQLVAMQTKHTSHSRAPGGPVMQQPPPMMMQPGINNLTPAVNLQQIGIPGSRLPNYIPQYNDPMMLGVGGLGGAMPANLNRLDNVQRHGFTAGGASELRRQQYHEHQRPLVMTLPTQVSHVQGMHNVRSVGPCSSWVKQSRLGDGSSAHEAATAGAPEKLARVGSCVMSLAGELSCQTSIDMPTSVRSTRYHSVHQDQLYQDVAVDAGACTNDNDVEPVMTDEKRKKRMLSNRASAQRSRLRRQERLDQLEVLTAQLRVENATLSRKASLAIEVAKKFEEDNKQLLGKLHKLRQVLDRVGGSKLWKPFKYIFDTDDCTSSQQTYINCMVGGQALLSPSRKKQATTQEDEVSSPCGSGYHGDSNQIGNNSGERQQEELSGDISESDHMHPDHDFNVQPRTTGKLSHEQLNNNVSTVSGTGSNSRKRPFGTGQMAQTLEIPPQSINSTLSDSRLDLNGSESNQDHMFSQFEIQLPQMLLTEDHFHSSSHIPASESVRSLETVFATTEEDLWLESFAYSL